MTDRDREIVASVRYIEPYVKGDGSKGWRRVVCDTLEGQAALAAAVAT